MTEQDVIFKLLLLGYTLKANYQFIYSHPDVYGSMAIGPRGIHRITSCDDNVNIPFEEVDTFLDKLLGEANV